MKPSGLRHTFCLSFLPQYNILLFFSPERSKTMSFDHILLEQKEHISIVTIDHLRPMPGTWRPWRSLRID